MKTTILRWSSVIAATLYATWVVLLTVLVIRCKLADQPFPVLAKFSPFREHLFLTGRMLRLFPTLALLAAGLICTTWYCERSFRSIRALAIACGVLVLLSLLVIAFNPGGYVSWFLS